MGLPNLAQEAANWVDTEEYAKDLRDRFTDLVNADPELRQHRDYIERHAYGMGERCFHWMWHLIVDAMPQNFSFLEVGVYKGQVLSLVRLLADRVGKKAQITGVTMLSSFAGVTGNFPLYPDEDYKKYIADLHDRFGLEQPALIVGDSTDEDVLDEVRELAPFDCVYIDGCHEYKYVVADLVNYAGMMLAKGGLLIVDDCSTYLHQPFGFFQGIEDVSRAVRTVIEPYPEWEHLLAVVHNRIWRLK